jgi:VWFA-related protein
MRFRLFFALVLASVSVAAVAQQTPVFRSTSDVVSLFVTAQDKAGRLITKLTREDFQVFDNGKPQPLTVFDNTPQPVRLIILIDISGSMARNLPLLAAACSEMVGNLAPGDLARIGTFGSEVAISPKFTRDARELAAWLPPQVAQNQPTPLWAAVDQAIKEFKLSGVEGRRVVMVLSDSKDSGPVKPMQPFLSPIEIIERANRDDVMVYGIGVRSALPAGGDIRSALASTLPDPSLGRVADDTGGGYFELLPRDNLQATFARVAEELRQQYLLGFAPPVRDGKNHKVEVKVKQDGAKVRVRKSYQAPKAGAPNPLH